MFYFEESGKSDIADIRLKLALNTNELINQSKKNYTQV